MHHKDRHRLDRHILQTRRSSPIAFVRTYLAEIWGVDPLNAPSAPLCAPDGLLRSGPAHQHRPSAPLSQLSVRVGRAPHSTPSTADRAARATAAPRRAGPGRVDRPAPPQLTHWQPTAGGRVTVVPRTETDTEHGAESCGGSCGGYLTVDLLGNIFDLRHRI